MLCRVVKITVSSKHDTGKKIGLAKIKKFENGGRNKWYNYNRSKSTNYYLIKLSTLFSTILFKHYQVI